MTSEQHIPGRDQRRKTRAMDASLFVRSVALDTPMPTVLPIDIAIEKARQVAALPPEIQSREAAVLVRCPKSPKRTLLARVFMFADVLVANPTGRMLFAGKWLPPEPWPVPPEHGVLRVRGKCCARDHMISAADIYKAIAARKTDQRQVTITAMR